MDSRDMYPFDRENSPPMAMPQPRKSPPLAFQMTSNDSLVAPSHADLASQVQFAPTDYLNNSSALGKLDQFDVASPMELDLQSQVRRQADALRLQHQAFVVERECWEMEKERLYKRIASLEGLLKSPKGHRSVHSPPDTLSNGSPQRRGDRSSHSHSPARSPVTSPFANNGSAATYTAPPALRTSNASSSSRLPSIAEHDASPQENKRSSSMQRETAPKFIHIPNGPAKSAINALEDELEVQADADEELPDSLSTYRQVLSPPPAAYRKDAGHTPLRLPSRPASSESNHRSSMFLDAMEATPTRRNTARNKSMGSDDEEDVALAGPLRLPELPGKPGNENFTMTALTARLQYITEHPDENQPLALSARSNRDDDESDMDDSDMTILAPKNSEVPKDTPSLSHGGISTAELSPPPASETSIASSHTSSQTSQSDKFPDNGGIVLKTKASINFGAPLGRLRM